MLQSNNKVSHKFKTRNWNDGTRQLFVLLYFVTNDSFAVNKSMQKAHVIANSQLVLTFALAERIEKGKRNERKNEIFANDRIATRINGKKYCFLNTQKTI